MNAETVRAWCLAFPHATENVQWGNDLVFKVGGKMFAVVNLEGGGNVVAMKCSPEDFAVLTEQDGIIPAPYLARASWVSLTRFDAMPLAELRKRLRASYEIVLAKLPKKQRLAL